MRSYSRPLITRRRYFLVALLHGAGHVYSYARVNFPHPILGNHPVYVGFGYSASGHNCDALFGRADEPNDSRYAIFYLLFPTRGEYAIDARVDYVL